MSKKSQVSATEQALLDASLKAIIAGLPQGFIATNKKPVQKEIRELKSPVVTTFWTSWVKDPDGNRHLALLLGSGRVKLISQEDLENYKHRSV